MIIHPKLKKEYQRLMLKSIELSRELKRVEQAIDEIVIAEGNIQAERLILNKIEENNN